MHGFHGPAAVHEHPGQVVEEFRVTWRLAELAEVAGRPDDAFAEVLLPQAIDHHAGRQRIVAAGNPPGKLHASAPSRDGWLPVPCQDAREMPRHQLAEPVVAPANVHADIVNASSLRKDEG